MHREIQWFWHNMCHTGLWSVTTPWHLAKMIFFTKIRWKITFLFIFIEFWSKISFWLKWSGVGGVETHEMSKLLNISYLCRIGYARMGKPYEYHSFRFLSWRLYKKDTQKTKRANESSNASILPSKRSSSIIEGPYDSCHECCT